MIQINLIPDVKQEFIHAQKMRSAVITFAILICGIAMALLAVLGLVYGGQAVRETLARNEIDKQYKTLKSIENIDQALTIQNQMSKIATIHGKKTINSRLFDVLTAINPPAPNNVKISNVTLDPATNTLSIEGSAENAFAATETFRKTILNTSVESIAEGQASTLPLTEEVIIGETSYGESADGSRVLRFTVQFVYPAGLFDNTLKVSRMISPTTKIDVTDSRTRVPDSLFSQQASDVEGEN